MLIGFLILFVVMLLNLHEKHEEMIAELHNVNLLFFCFIFGFLFHAYANP